MAGEALPIDALTLALIRGAPSWCHSLLSAGTNLACCHPWSHRAGEKPGRQNHRRLQGPGITQRLTSPG